MGNTFYWNNRKLGTICDDRFVTTRKKEHFYRKIGGFCFNKKMIYRFPVLEVNWIVVIYEAVKQKQELFKVSVEHLIDKGKIIKESEFEEQIALPLTDFDVHKK